MIERKDPWKKTATKPKALPTEPQTDHGGPDGSATNADDKLSGRTER